jgi:hypothetical protein
VTGGTLNTADLNVTGAASFSGNVSIAGVITATSFSGDGSALTGIAGTANVSTNTLNVAGVSTFSSSASVSGDLDVASDIRHIGDIDTRLRFETDTISARTAGNERLRITSAGFVGIGTDIPNSYDSGARTFVLDQSGTLAGMSIRSSTQGSIYFADGLSGNEAYRGRIEYNHTNDRLQFGTSGTGSKVNIDSSGRLLIGTSTVPTVCGQNFREVLNGTDFATTGKVQIRYESGTQGPTLLLTHARGTEASPAALLINDQYGKIRFVGHDGSDFTNWGAEIAAFVDNTPGSDDMPGRLVFSTTADGGSQPTERARITSTGKCQVYKGTSTTGKTSGSEAFTVGNGGGNHRFAVYPDGTTVIGGTGDIGNNHIQLNNNGDASFAGDISFASGKGISFINAADTATNETVSSSVLDDYEEGTWSPTIGGSATYDIQWGYYIRVGKLVQLWGGLRPNSMGSGNARMIKNLPYTCINSPTTTYSGGGNIVWGDNSATSYTNTPSIMVDPNTNEARIALKNGASTILQDSFDFWQNNHRANFYICYYAKT